MKLRKSIYFLVLLVLASSCVSQSDYDSLLAENEKLKTQLDECLFGEEKLVAIIEKSYSGKDYTATKQNIEDLIKRHPESSRIGDFEKYLVRIEKAELAEKKRKEAEDAERVRLANINNTGMWKVAYYVDDFGEPTKEAYIRNTSLIRGVFSNTATQDSELDVKFLISNSNEISLMLYEYARNNPVKAYSSDEYRVQIQDKDGKRYKLTATNYSDRLHFDKSGSWQVHSVLLKGGTIKFQIIEADTPTTEYEFTIQNADYYENAHRIRKGK